MIQIEVSDQIAWVTLDRPEVHNAFNQELVTRVTATFDQVGQRSDVRVVVLAGSGKSFCAGGDLSWMQQTVDFTEDENLGDARKMAAMFRAIAVCPRPVIARVHGAALGGGAGLVAAADLAIADEATIFGFTEVRLGIVPGVISPYVVSRIGVGRAREYCLTGERFPATTAHSIGLVHQVVPDAVALDRAVRVKAAEILKAPPVALAETKALIAGVGTLSADAASDAGARALARARSGDEGRAGIRAFLERREPPWVKE